MLQSRDDDRIDGIWVQRVGDELADHLEWLFGQIDEDDTSACLSLRADGGDEAVVAFAEGGVATLDVSAFGHLLKGLGQQSCTELREEGVVALMFDDGDEAHHWVGFLDSRRGAVKGGGVDEICPVHQLVEVRLESKAVDGRFVDEFGAGREVCVEDETVALGCALVEVLAVRVVGEGGAVVVEIPIHLVGGGETVVEDGVQLAGEVLRSCCLLVHTVATRTIAECQPVPLEVLQEAAENDGTAEPVETVSVGSHEDLHVGERTTCLTACVHLGPSPWSPVRVAPEVTIPFVAQITQLRRMQDEQNAMRPVVLCADRLPVGIADLPDPPQRLYLWGRMPPRPWVAVVGTRRASDGALAYTRQLSAELTRAGATVVSGGAQGIDAAAHEGALDAGGCTVIVAPSSFEKPYPAAHADLFQRVVDRGGGVLSEHGRGVSAKRHVFFARNAIMVACSSAVVLMEAPFRSGARNATQWARRLKRALFVVPHPPWHSAGRGNITELQLGGRPLASHRDVLKLLARAGHPLITTGPPCVQPSLWEDGGSAHSPARGAGSTAHASTRAPLVGALGSEPGEAMTDTQPNATGDVDVVLAALSARDFVQLDTLCECTGLSASHVQQQLTHWVLDGTVEVGASGYRRAR